MLLACGLSALAGCGGGSSPAPRSAALNPPEASGLVARRAYPRPGAECAELERNAVTAPHFDSYTVVIGCPSDALQAIEDRRREGARIVGRAGAWTLLSLPTV